MMMMIMMKSIKNKNSLNTALELNTKNVKSF